MEPAVAASTAIGTLRKMALLVGYLWVGATTLVAFFIGLLAGQLFRPRREEENNEHDSSTSASVRHGEPLAKTSKRKEEEGEEEEEEEEEEDGGGKEEEPHVFQFKFSFQIPEQSISGRGVPAGEDGGSSTVTSVSNYRFISDSGCRGVVEAPQAMTLRVRESYVDIDGSVRSTPEKWDGELENRLRLPAAVGYLDVSGDAVAPNEAVGNSSGALDRALQRRVSLLKHPKSDGGVSKGFDRELKNSSRLLLSPESSPVYDSADVGAAACATQNTHRRGNSTRAHDAPEESEEIVDVKLLDGADAPAGNYHGLSSDSESESMSDGYSVKDLSLDFDSDGLFPEEDVEADVDRASSSGLEFEQEEAEATQLSNSPDSAGGSKPSEGEEDAESQQGTVNICGEIRRETLVNQVIDVHGDLCAAGQGRADQLGAEEESESSESRGTKGTELSDSCGSDKEPVDLGIGNQNTKTSNLSSSQVLSEGRTATSDSEPEHVTGEDTGDAAEGSDDQLGQGSEDEQDSEEWSMEEMEEMECLWEHDDLLDQMMVDLKKAARATGLPTILEESESPKPAEGLEPWKPDTPLFLREDPVEGLHKFYRSYRDRMRKLDVLNRQNMYAFGFLQLTDPPKPVGTQKAIIPAVASVLSRNFWRRRTGAGGPSEELVKELRSGIELVYVGQTCLSWEFLRHQYEATRELLGSDPHDGGRRYNQVAEEFQQFQVLVERFLENEPFQGPRVPNYAKNRCVLRRLLQVPVVRGDCFKDKAEARRNSAGATTGEELGYVMEDSIRVFWDFVKSEKDETPSSIVRGLFGARVHELQDPADSGFMADIQTSLRQKQNKLKDVLRSGNCIVNKYLTKKKEKGGGGPSQDELFFSQVDLKLVSRVLRMTRVTTDQLVWCHKKLSKITFNVDRKLTREPTFLLFPC